MDSQCWDGDADAPRPVIELPNGDVWVGTADAAARGGRRFRCHLGHVVEVFDSGRIRRVGPGLRPVRPWLLVDGPLDAVIERALADGDGDAVAWQSLDRAEPAGPLHPAASPRSFGSLGHLGLFDRLAALLHRGGADAKSGESVASASSASPWRDTMPWTHPR